MIWVVKKNWSQNEIKGTSLPTIFYSHKIKPAAIPFFPPGKECQFSRYEFSSTEALRVAIFPTLLAVSLVPHALLELCPLISER